MRRTTSFAGIQIAEESDEENDHEQDREQRLESNADPSVEGALIEDDSQKRNFVRKSSSALSLLSMSQASNSTSRGFWKRTPWYSSSNRSSFNENKISQLAYFQR